MTTIARGNTGRLSVQFTPPSGTVDVDDVICTVTSPSLAGTSLTVVQSGINRFYADVVVDDSTELGVWSVRWDSNSPSPLVTVSDSYTVVAFPPTGRSRSLVSNTIERIRRQLDSSVRQEVNELGANLTASTTDQSVFFRYDVPQSVYAGSIISIGRELMRVYSVDRNAKELTVRRAWQDSPLEAHLDPAEILINPRFTRMDIFDAIVAEITSWEPQLFRTATYQWAVTDENDTVELPNEYAHAIGVISLRRRWDEETDRNNWPTIDYRLMSGDPAIWTDGAVASGRLVRLLHNHGMRRGGAIVAQLAVPFDVTQELLESEDLVDDYELAHSMLELVDLGVKMRLMGDAENARSARDAQDEVRRAEEVPPNSALQVAQTIRTTYLRRFGDEVRKLQDRFPVTSW